MCQWRDVAGCLPRASLIEAIGGGSSDGYGTVAKAVDWLRLTYVWKGFIKLPVYHGRMQRASRRIGELLLRFVFPIGNFGEGRNARCLPMQGYAVWGRVASVADRYRSGW